MNHQFKWWCCRYLLRVIFVRDNRDSKNEPNPAIIVHQCRDLKYRPERPDMTCDKEDCGNLPSEARTAADRFALFDRGYVASTGGLKTRAEGD